MYCLCYEYIYFTWQYARYIVGYLEIEWIAQMSVICVNVAEAPPIYFRWSHTIRNSSKNHLFSTFRILLLKQWLLQGMISGTFIFAHNPAKCHNLLINSVLPSHCCPCILSFVLSKASPGVKTCVNPISIEFVVRYPCIGPRCARWLPVTNGLLTLCTYSELHRIVSCCCLVVAEVYWSISIDSSERLRSVRSWMCILSEAELF